MPVAGLCTTVELTGDRDVIADADLVSAFRVTCAGSEFAIQSSDGWSIDPSSLIGLLFPVLLEERRSAEGSNTTVAGRSVAVGLTGGGDMVADADPVSAFGAGCTGSEFLPSNLGGCDLGGCSVDRSLLIDVLSTVLSGVERICSAGRFSIIKSPIPAANTLPEAAKPIRMPRRKPCASIWRS